MFEKLLSLVPYNPGLLPQLSFYSRRMREEASIRRTGTIFLVLAFMLQFFAVLSPPQSTVASSYPANDIIRGGLTDRADAVAKCRANTQDFEHILRHFGISCDDVAQATNRDIHVSSGVNYYSMGRQPNHDSSEYAVEIPGDDLTLFVHTLKSNALSDEFHTLRVTASNNGDRVFYILKDCGNLASIGKPTIVKQSLTLTKNPRPALPTTTFPTYTLPKTTPTPTPNPTPCPYSPTLRIEDINCKPCEKSTSISDSAACIVISKSALNVTAGGNDANNTIAHAGDVITYTLSAQNNGKGTVKNFSFNENINDVLSYADIIDLHGGSKDDYNMISWPAQDISANSTATHQITVKVKDPIPNTPADPQNAYRFDLVMANTYGNTVTINLPGSPTKQVESATTALPNTGPGTSLMIAALIVVLAGYFYGRANLLAKESKIAVKETAMV